MTDRPIIFSAPMVRALLEGRKTQTRRMLNPQPGGIKSARILGSGWALAPESNRCSVDWTPPRYAPGDRLYVREACHVDGRDVNYRADAPVGSEPPGPWRPSIHMPRWASRLTLTVTDVRVQRLQDISAYDVQAEGACELACVPPNDEDEAEAQAIFRDLWNSLHGPAAWDANPWVVALTFTVQHGNIDQIGKG